MNRTKQPRRRAQTRQTMTHASRNHVLSAANGVGERIASAGTAVRDIAAEGAHRVARGIKAQRRAAVNTVREYPLSSVMVGIGIGVAMGMMLPLMMLKRSRWSF